MNPYSKETQRYKGLSRRAAISDAKIRSTKMMPPAPMQMLKIPVHKRLRRVRLTKANRANPRTSSAPKNINQRSTSIMVDPTWKAALYSVTYFKRSAFRNAGIAVAMSKPDISTQPLVSHGMKNMSTAVAAPTIEIPEPRLLGRSPCFWTGWSGFPSRFTARPHLWQYAAPGDSSVPHQTQYAITHPLCDNAMPLATARLKCTLCPDTFLLAEEEPSNRFCLFPDHLCCGFNPRYAGATKAAPAPSYRLGLLRLAVARLNPLGLVNA